MVGVTEVLLVLGPISVPGRLVELLRSCVLEMIGVSENLEGDLGDVLI